MEQYSSLKAKSILFSKGIAMGIADIIPGVSGGTIAFISGIYEHLIQAISSVRPLHALSVLKLLALGNKRIQSEGFRELAEIQWGFLLPLMTGILMAVLLMSRVVPYFLTNFPMYTYALFFGLILASIPMIWVRMTHDAPSYVTLAAFAALMFLLMGDAGAMEGSKSLPYIFIAGALAICAMILPGISGSYILVLLGEYIIILEALHNRELTILAVFISGIAVGILSFTRLLKYLLREHHAATMASLTGIMVGSLRAIWPGKHAPETGLGLEALLGTIGIAATGAILIYALNRVSARIGDPEPPVESAHL